jgi:hypothetical protein
MLFQNFGQYLQIGAEDDNIRHQWEVRTRGYFSVMWPVLLQGFNRLVSLMVTLCVFCEVGNKLLNVSGKFHASNESRIFTFCLGRFFFINYNLAYVN